MNIAPVDGKPPETFGKEEQVGSKKKLASELFEAMEGPARNELEKSPLLIKLREARISKEEYLRYLGAFYGIYSSLEAGLERNKQNVCIGPLCIPELYRSESLRSDLSCFKVRFQYPGKVLQSYQRYIQEISYKDPLKLISHAFTRYVRDLLGQKMRKKVEKLGDKAVAFYDFGKLMEVYKLKKLKGFFMEYINIINKLLVKEEDHLTLISEIDNALLWHKRVFEEISSEFSDD